jgi:hypothetical protein
MDVASGSNDRFPVWHWLVLVIAGLYVLIWPIVTAGRLAAIGWSRWWVVAFAAPWLFFICVANWGSGLWTLAALFVVILAQLPFLLIKGRVLGGVNLGIRLSDEPRA